MVGVPLTLYRYTVTSEQGGTFTHEPTAWRTEGAPTKDELEEIVLELCTLPYACTIIEVQVEEVKE